MMNRMGRGQNLFAIRSSVGNRIYFRPGVDSNLPMDLPSLDDRSEILLCGNVCVCN